MGRAEGSFAASRSRIIRDAPERKEGELWAMKEDKLQEGAHWATIGGSIVTAASVLFAACTYYQTSQTQAEAAAVAVLQEYLKLAIEHPSLASRGPNTPVDSRYSSWFASHAFFTAETIYTLTDGEHGWDRAISAILREHHSYVIQKAFPCGDFDPDFVSLVRRRFPGMKCSS